MRKYVDLMIDIETLGVTPGCVIMSVGICPVFPESNAPSFYVRINVAESIKAGFTINEDTQAWWYTQDRELYLETSGGLETPNNFCSLLTSYLSELGDRNNIKLWAKGVAFDLPIVEAYFKKQGFAVPWHYGAPMCYRTMKDVFYHVPEPLRVGKAHSAIDDARHQAIHLREIFNAR